MTEEMLGNERFIARLVRDESRLAEKILGKIHALLNAFSRLTDKNARAEYNRLKRAEKLYMDAVENAGFQYDADGRILKAINENEEDEREDLVEYSAKVSSDADLYRNRIDSWDRKTQGFSFVIGDTSGVLSNIEIGGKKIGNKQVRIDASKIKTILAEHSDMTIDAIKDLPRLIDDPLLILDSKTVSGRLVLVGEIYGTNGRPVIVALEIYPTAKNNTSFYDNIIKIASAYPRKNLQNLIGTSNIRYVNPNKNRVDDWLKVNRLQLPLLNSQSDSVNNSITDKTQNVNGNGKNNSGKVSYSLKSFSSQIDDVLSGADTTSTHLRVMDTPSILQEAGLPNLPILLTAQHLKTISGKNGKGNANYHNLDISIVKKLPQYISEPILIADSFTREDSVVIITDAVDSQNRPVIAAIKLNGNGRVEQKHIKANILTSAYGKDNFQSFLDRIAETDSTIYWDKAKSQDMAVSLGIQFPNAISNLDSNTIIRKAKAFVKENEKKTSGNVSYSLKNDRAATVRKIKANANANNQRVYTKADSQKAGAELYQKRIETWDQETEGFSFVVGESPTALSDIEIDGKKVGKKQIRIDATKVKKILFEHSEMTIEAIQNLPNLIQNPILILDSKTVKGRLVLVGEVYASNNRPIIVALEINPTTRSGNSSYNNIIKIASAYPRKNLQNLIETSNIRYVDPNKNRVNDWLKVNRLQLPLPNSQSDSVNNSITDKTQNVNGNGKNNSGKVSYSLKNDRAATVRKIKANANANNQRVYTKADSQRIVEGMSDSERSGRGEGEGNEGIDRNGNQRSGAFEKTKGDVRYSLKPAATVGQSIKSDANENRQKVYTREDARKIVNDAIASSKHFAENRGALVGKRRAEVIEALWKGLNQAEPGKQMGVALDVADSIIRAASLEERLSPAERKGVRQEIARKILQGFVDYGSPSKLSRVVNESAERMNRMRETVQTTKQEAAEREARARLAAQVIRLKKAVKDRHYRAHEFNDPTFRGSIERMFNYATRNNVLSSDVVRRNLGELSKWYTEKNPLLQNGFSAEDGGVENTLFVPFVKTWLDDIAGGEGELTVQECKTVKKVFSYFQKLVEEYHLVNVNGEMKDADEVAKTFIEKIDEAGDRINGAVSTYLKTTYGRENTDPRSVMRFGDQYIEGGFFMETFEALSRGGIEASWEELDIGRAREAFLKEHKAYHKRLQEHTVEYQGKRIPLENAMNLYMTGKDVDSHAHLVKGGFGINVDRKTARELAWTDDKHSDRVQYCFDPLEPNPSASLDRDSMKDLVKEQKKALEAQFSKEDLAYIKILEDMMARATTLKRATDYRRYGTTNVKEGYYMTLVTAEVAKTIDKMSFLEYTDRVTNASFNKSRVQGAASMLSIGRATDVVLHHVKQVALYAHLAVPTDTFNKLYNRNVKSSNPNRPITIKSRLQSTKAGRDLCDYLFKMMRNIEGTVRTEAADRWWNRVIGTVRKKFVVFQLALNIKVRFSQAASLLAATNILDYDCIVKAFGVKNKGSEIDRYCHLAEVRNHENAAALSRGVVDKLGKGGDKLLSDIGRIDRKMNELLFGACQVQIEKNGGAKIGSEENKRAAGELLTRVILETQQNALASERTGWMRSAGEIRKALTMFSADIVKSMARVLDAVGEISAIKRRLKKGDLSPEERQALKLALKHARKKLRRALAAHLSNALYCAIIALGINSLLAKNDDKEEEEIVKNTAGDFFGNLLGGLPVIRDVYSMLADGYEADHFLYSTLNDIAEGAKSLMDMSGAWIEGKEVSKQEFLGNVKKATYATGQLLGFPVRNAYNLFTGVSNRFFPQFGYTVESQFTVQSYSADLNAAIEAGDDKMVATIAGLMIDEDLGSLSRDTREAIRPLVEAGYKVLPRSLGDSVTVDGEVIELTRAEKKQFAKIYSVADTVVADLVKLDAFKKATQEEQAKAIRFVWNTYYQLALDDLLGEDTEERTVLFAEAIPVEKLALIVATVREITADTDRRGNAIAGSRKKKVIAYIESLKLTAAQKYMLAGWAGYRNVHGKAQVKAYINTLNLSAAEKEALFKYSGYEAA
ncbi:MAG: hypothetical protein IJW50_09060 [Clostridia bacterium]|nr:hypothetical protein [Clostridia bacterium]